MKYHGCPSCVRDMSRQGAGKLPYRSHAHCLVCGVAVSFGRLFCHLGCAKPDPERVRELQESDESSATRRARWMRDGRES